MGILGRVPITMGSLTLEIDAMVTYASTYHVLIGNDWLQMASADILLSSNLIRLRLGREVWEELPIQANTGAPRINMLFPEDASSNQQEAEDPTPCEDGHSDIHWDFHLQDIIALGHLLDDEAAKADLLGTNSETQERDTLAKLQSPSPTC